MGGLPLRSYSIVVGGGKVEVRPDNGLPLFHCNPENTESL
jgi:hypothetical protein